MMFGSVVVAVLDEKTEWSTSLVSVPCDDAVTDRARKARREGSGGPCATAAVEKAPPFLCGESLDSWAVKAIHSPCRYHFGWAMKTLRFLFHLLKEDCGQLGYSSKGTTRLSNSQLEHPYSQTNIVFSHPCLASTPFLPSQSLPLA